MLPLRPEAARHDRSEGAGSSFSRRVGIVGIGSYLPERAVHNAELARTLDTSDEWIRRKLGVHSRRWANESETVELMACRAAQAALLDAGVGASDIGLIIVATSTPDMPLPPVACTVQRAIAAERAAAFDVGAVCSGFVFALTVAIWRMQAQRPGSGAALVIGADAYSRILDHRDRSTCVIFGDGAGAVVVADTRDDLGVRNACLRTDAEHRDLVTCPRDTDGRFKFRMQGRAVRDYAISTFPRIIEEAVTGSGDRLSDVDWVVPHQANAEIIRESLRQLGMPEDRAIINIATLGNTAAASIPLALEEGRRRGSLKLGDRVVLAAVGGGMSAGAIYSNWSLNALQHASEGEKRA